MAVSDIIHQIQEEAFIEKSGLEYMKEPNSAAVPVTFGGNLDVKKRKRYFNYSEGTDLPCGFVNHHSPGFVVSEEDRKAMELCRDLVVISAIFGAYDRIKQPKNVRRITTEKVCFFMFMDNATLTGLARYQIKLDESHRIGIWRIIEQIFDGFVNLMVLNKMFFIINSTYCIFLYAGCHISPFLFQNFSNQFIGCLEENIQRNFHVVRKVVYQRKIPFENGINKQI